MPELLNFILYYIILKGFFGITFGMLDQINRIDINIPKWPFFISLLLSFIVLIFILFIETSKFNYNIRFIYLNALAVIGVFFPLAFSNFLFRKKLLGLPQGTTSYVLQDDRWGISEQFAEKLRKFNKLVLILSFFIFSINIISVASRYISAPVDGHFILQKGSDIGLGVECDGSLVIWSGSRNMIVSCNKKYYVSHMPQNLTLSVKKYS